MLEDTTAFTWEKIPGEEDEKLKKILNKRYSKKLEDAKIEKNNSNNIIKVSNENDVILLNYVYKKIEKYIDDRYVVTVEINGKEKKTPLILIINIVITC